MCYTYSTPMEQLVKIYTKIALFGRVQSSTFPEISRQTFLRLIKKPLEEKTLKREGKGRSVSYTRGEKFYLAAINEVDYFAIDQAKRLLWVNDPLIENSLEAFEDGERNNLKNLQKEWRKRYNSASETIKKREFERITIELSWKSSHIEGNTYSLLDTENLLKENKEAKNHPKEEAVMILNHKRCISFIQENKKYFAEISRQKIEELHAILTEGLGIEKGFRKSPVGIIGTEYRPAENVYHIQEIVEQYIKKLNKKSDTCEKAFSALVIIAATQPFADGNKRTSRMLANAFLIAHDHPPMSFRSIDEVEYKKAIIMAYELQSLSLLKKLFLEQYREAATKYFV